MADKKISQLTGATTPLAGSEVLPIVQGGSTVKVSVANVTAGRAVAGASFQAGGRVTVGPSYIADVPGPTGNNTGFLFGGNIIYPCDGAGSLTDGVVSLGSGSYQFNNLSLAGNVIPAAGKGIDFSANTHAAGMTSELLNDYEEGTWTPILTDGVNDAVMGSGACQYTKIGRLVTVQGYVYTTSLGSVTGGLNIKGLPFPPLSGGANFTSAAVGFGDSLAITAGQSVGVRITPGSTTAIVALWNSVTGSTVMQASEWTANGEIMFTLSYVVA